MLNIYLYDLSENAELRRSDWVVQRGNGTDASKRRPPVRINATYLVTAWAGDVESEHMILWAALAALLKYSELPEKYLQGRLKDLNEPIPARVLSPQEAPSATELWNALGNELRPAIHYRVTLPLDVEEELETRIVLTRRLKVEQGQARKGPFDERWQIAGVVRDLNGNPMKGAVLKILENGIKTKSGEIDDEEAGRYTFLGLQPGTYTIQVSAVGSPEWQQTICVPQQSYDLQTPAESAQLKNAPKPKARRMPRKK